MNGLVNEQIIVKVRSGKAKWTVRFSHHHLLQLILQMFNTQQLSLEPMLWYLFEVAEKSLYYPILSLFVHKLGLFGNTYFLCYTLTFSIIINTMFWIWQGYLYLLKKHITWKLKGIEKTQPRILLAWYFYYYFFPLNWMMSNICNLRGKQPILIQILTTGVCIIHMKHSHIQLSRTRCNLWYTSFYASS